MSERLSASGDLPTARADNPSTSGPDPAMVKRRS